MTRHKVGERKQKMMVEDSNLKKNLTDSEEEG
jgi:hypothetical protein